MEWTNKQVFNEIPSNALGPGYFKLNPVNFDGTYLMVIDEVMTFNVGPFFSFQLDHT
jgi:hypothetical protein